MDRKLVINDTPHETRVALLEEGSIAEVFIERKDDLHVAGNIYKGRVQRILPGMQAAFIDIGMNQAAFIYVDDVLDSHFREMEPIFPEIDINGSDDGEDLDSTGRAMRNRYPIEEILIEGQEILVQVAKSPMASKGARVTSHVSLPGRFLVLMPESEHIGVSRRIEDEAERTRLKTFLTAMRKDSLGYIVRTAAEGIQEEKLAYEMQFLDNIWKNVLKKYQMLSAPSLIHQELKVILRAVRDLLTQEAETLVIDSKSGYESVTAFLEEFMPSLKSSVQLYEGKEPIFDAFNLEGDISRALKRKVWLKSGGYIVIEQAEALVAIDVNTGRYVGKHNLEETILKTNLEAVKEIAYQIRLRDLGGIIIIDFIDMNKKVNQEKVFNALKEALKKDRSKTHILPISEMGLIQMTRKRIRKSLGRTLCEPCFYCDGEGYLISKQSICFNIYREVIRQAQDMIGSRMTIRVNPGIAELLHGEENQLVGSMERKIGKQIVIYPDSRFHLEEFDICEILKE